MKPFSLIRVMDVYQNPNTNTEWLVLEKNKEEKMIQIVMLRDGRHYNRTDETMWKRNTDRIFSFPCVQTGYEE